MKNDRPPACKYKIWLMGNKESSLPGLSDHIVRTLYNTCIQPAMHHACNMYYADNNFKYIAIVIVKTIN